MVYPRLYGHDSQGERIPVCFPDTAVVQFGPGWDRLAITTAGSALDLMVQLLGDHPGPFRVLFILIIARNEEAPGRYALEESLERWQLLSLLADHRDLFEQDGRHHVWISTEDNAATLVYDQHDFIYAYGDTQGWLGLLEKQGFENELPSIPVPHMHAFHLEFDESVSKLLAGYPWHYSPLRDGDNA